MTTVVPEWAKAQDAESTPVTRVCRTCETALLVFPSGFRCPVCGPVLPPKEAVKVEPVMESEIKPSAKKGKN